jgi:transposase
MSSGGARILRPDRGQLSWDLVDLEALLASDHRARIVWAFVEGLELSAFYDAIGSRDGEAGRPAADPAVLLALWLYATLEGVGSARELDRLVKRDLAYRWIAGGVAVNHHGLADFRVGHAEALDRLLTQSVTSLVAARIVTLEEIAVDGTKVRAPVSGKSFTAGGRLERIERQARERIEQLKAEVKTDPAASGRRKQAAQARAAQAALDKVAKARETLEKLSKEKARREKTHRKAEAAKGDPKTSLTDPQARMMRFADGAIRPGYNIQVAAVPRHGLVVGVEATDRRNDTGLAGPMVEDMVRRYRRTPNRLLVDDGYAAQEDIAAFAEHPKGAVEVYMPLPSEKPEEQLTPSGLYARTQRLAELPEPLQAWRERMQSPEGQAVFGRRKLIERVNAHFKNRGFGRLTVKGLLKAKAVAIWQALANNLMVGHRLRLQAAA